MTLLATPLAWWSLTHSGAEMGVDALAYWLPDPIGRYGSGALEGAGQFMYAPPLALPVFAFGILPIEVFVFAWAAMLAAVLAWLVGPRWLVLAIAVPFVARELVFGNIHILMAAAIVGAPVLWLLPIMAKVTPVVLLGWFVARREWGSLGKILGVGLALGVVSELALPGSWSAWFTMLHASAGSDALYLPLRLVAAGLLAFHAGLTGRRWILPVALLLSLPHLGWSSPAVLVAVPTLLQRREADVVEARGSDLAGRAVAVDADRGDGERGVVTGKPARPIEAV